MLPMTQPHVVPRSSAPAASRPEQEGHRYHPASTQHLVLSTPDIHQPLLTPDLWNQSQVGISLQVKLLQISLAPFCLFSLGKIIIPHGHSHRTGLSWTPRKCKASAQTQTRVRLVSSQKWFLKIPASPSQDLIHLIFLSPLSPSITGYLPSRLSLDLSQLTLTLALGFWRNAPMGMTAWCPRGRFQGLGGGASSLAWPSAGSLACIPSWAVHNVS